MIGNVIIETPWEIARCGKFTSSKIDDLLTEPKTKAAKEAGELGETAKTYILGRASEIVTGTRRDFTTASTEHGNLYEAEAAELLLEFYPTFEYMGKEDPQFFKYSDFSGGSPDGVDVAEKTIHEIKCPENPLNHVRYCLLKTGEDLKKAERDYYHQIQMNMLCVAKHYDWNILDVKAVFTSYSPIVNPPYRKMSRLIVYPDMEAIQKIVAVIPKAEEELANIVWLLQEHEPAPSLV